MCLYTAGSYKPVVAHCCHTRYLMLSHLLCAYTCLHDDDDDDDEDDHDDEDEDNDKKK